jgi:hypothetical protein
MAGSPIIVFFYQLNNGAVKKPVRGLMIELPVSNRSRTSQPETDTWIHVSALQVNEVIDLF